MKLDFNGLDGSGVRVGVIDSGVEISHTKIGPLTEAVELREAPDGASRWVPTEADRAGHGTACAGIIRRIAPRVELYSAAILDDSLSTPGAALVEALRWAAGRRLDVVNLSLGCTDPAFRELLRSACREAVSAGVIVVAAVHNEGRECYPAAFAEVLSVGGGSQRGLHEYRYLAGGVPECEARGDLQRVCWRGGRELLASGTSFAAPHLTGIVALIRQALPGADLEQVRQVLRDHTTAPMPQSPSPHPAQARGVAPEQRDSRRGSRHDWIRRAVLYPFNKEMHALVRGRDLLGFSIAGVADPPGKGLVGRDAGEVLGLPAAGLPIRARLEATLTETEADTLILGCVDELGRLARRDLLREGVTQALDRGLNVFSLLSVRPETYPDLHAQAASRGLRLVYPGLPQAEVAAAVELSSSAAPITAPVLGVFGTSSQQGKFTLQLELRRQLLAAGYRLAQVGTEPHAELFGMDLTFPMGYASPLDLPLQLYVPYLDGSLKAICRATNPDLVVVGCQSGVIPYDLEEHAAGSLVSLAFLLGTRPDAGILVVNPADPPEYLRDTVAALAAVAGTRTLGLAISDRTREVGERAGRPRLAQRALPADEVASVLARLEAEFGLPSACIGDPEGVARLVAEVVRCFAETEGGER